MRCDGTYNKNGAANLLKNLSVKKIENHLRINRVTATSMVSLFLDHDIEKRSHKADVC